MRAIAYFSPVVLIRMETDTKTKVSSIFQEIIKKVNKDLRAGFFGDGSRYQRGNGSSINHRMEGGTMP
jgi:hypothetical protein